MTKTYMVLFALLMFVLLLFLEEQEEYFEAVETYWPNVQAHWQKRTEFSKQHAQQFREGAALSQRVSAKLGQAAPDNRAEQIAREVEREVGYYLWLSQSKLKSLNNVSCVPADDLPGENCEMKLTLIGTDGKEKVLTSGWRFDEVDGKTTVVGNFQNPMKITYLEIK